METGALLFMLLAWCFTLGLLTFCTVMLLKNPEAASAIFGDEHITEKKLGEEDSSPKAE